MNVLLVQQSPDDMEAIKAMLQDAAGDAFRVHWMSRLSTAIERLRARGLDIVLFDLSASDSLGPEGLAQLHAAFPAVAVVVLAGDDVPAESFAALLQRAQDVLPKRGLNGPLLAASLKYAYERKRSMTATAAEDRRRQWHSRIWASDPLVSSGGARPSHAIISAPRTGPDVAQRLEDRYARMVCDYVQAFRIQRELPRPEIEHVALAMYAAGLGARDIARLHARILDRISKRALPETERAFSADARLVLIEVLGRILDIHRERRRPQGGRPEAAEETRSHQENTHV